MASHEWKAIVNTTNGLYHVMRRTKEDCMEYHIQKQWDPVMHQGYKVVGGWTEGPLGERCHDWGDTESRAPLVHHVFQSSQNKGRWVRCQKCEERLPNGAPYRPVGYSLKLCLSCAEKEGV